MMPAGFEHVQETAEVTGEISIGIGKAVAYTGLGSKGEDPVKRILSEQLKEIIPVIQVQFNEAVLRETLKSAEHNKCDELACLGDIVGYDTRFL